MRSLAAFFDHARADFAAVTSIDSGDALSLATRFAMGWAYRDGQALFWNDRFKAVRVREGRVPLCIDGAIARSQAHLIGVRLTRDRNAIRDLRATRSAIRELPGVLLLFAAGLQGRTRFADLGLDEAPAGAGECVAARGFRVTAVETRSAAAYLGTIVRARPAVTA